ncbi:MAG: GGDEF domain-containing protein [Acidobacteria bacterium]|nr:GGDEF domain-containing protein [Acidobacteriota bacterium]
MFTGEREFWLLSRQPDRWEALLRDSLTNCVSRDHGLETLDREMERARRSKQPLSILMVDIDQFKLINDGLGHLRGDELLREVGTLLT